ncbi:MAG: hypothetical protein ACYCPS_04750 [Candidatus Saccharimonadales bacterium]
MLDKLTTKILRIIYSPWFFRVIIIFFIFESAWIALTAAYPQAFDEQFHFGLIQLYSHHLSPFLSKQPANADQFGAVARDPSYLYHYIMSFPYGLIEQIFKSQTYQIIALRFLDIAMFSYGLVLFRRILIRANISRGLSNVTILIFTLIPIVPQLAGQINYDDMLFPLVAICCLLGFRIIEEIKNLKLSFKDIALLLIISTFTCLIKFAYIPIFLAMICFFLFYIGRYYRNKLNKLWRSVKSDFKHRSLAINLLLIGLFIVASAMFAQRDIVNVIQYHSVDPSCSSVIGVNSCKAYSAWYANYRRHQDVISSGKKTSWNIIVYGGEWLYWMWYRLFFAVNGANSRYANYPPLPLPSAVALVIGVLGLIAVIKYRKKVFKGATFSGFMLTLVAFYAVALFLQGFSTYKYTAVLENMNGRYLIPILLFAGAIIAKALSIALKKYQHTKVIITCLAILLFLEGGGFITYIARSDDSWYWQNSKVIKINHVAKKITKHIVVRGKTKYNTNVWFFN